MSCLPSQIEARVRAQIAKLEPLLTLAYTAYTAALGEADVESYKFDSKEGSQQTSMRSPSVVLKQIDMLESQLSRLYRRLEGGGLVNMNLRRRRR